VKTEWTCWRDASHETTIHPDFGWPRCAECGAAPEFHERPSYLDERLELTIYIPNRGHSFIGAMVAPRSGIVGLPMGERALVYYEGWVNGPAQYADRDVRGLWEAGIEHAAGRMVCQYPTVALMSPKVDELEAIGTYNPTTRVVTVTDEKALEGWLA
jgi:hypothetical protein